VEEAAKDYLRHLQALGQSPGTIYHKASYLRALFLFLTRHRIKSLQAVTPRVVESYHAHLIQTKNRATHKPVTRRHVYDVLLVIRQFFTHLHRRRLILLNPAGKLSWRSPPKALPKHIPNEEAIRQILERPNTNTRRGLRDRAMLELLYSTGIRRQELVNLTLYDIDFTGGTLKVNKGKGGKDRVVPIGKEARAWVARYIEKARRPATYETALFLGYHGRSIAAPRLGPILEPYLRGERPEPGLSCHLFRHACATHMMKGGARLRFIQEMLGHAHLQTTQIYTHLSPTELKEAHRKHHPHGRASKKQNLIDWPRRFK